MLLMAMAGAGQAALEEATQDAAATHEQLETLTADRADLAGKLSSAGALRTLPPLPSSLQLSADRAAAFRRSSIPGPPPTGAAAASIRCPPELRKCNLMAPHVLLTIPSPPAWLLCTGLCTILRTSKALKSVAAWEQCPHLCLCPGAGDQAASDASDIARLEERLAAAEARVEAADSQFAEGAAAAEELQRQAEVQVGGRPPLPHPGSFRTADTDAEINQDEKKEIARHPRRRMK